MQTTTFSELRHDEDGRMFLKGVLFSGIAIDYWPDGSKASEVSFDQGIEHGASRLWHPNGTLAEETSMVQGCARGAHREWYPSGQMKLEEVIGERGHLESRVRRSEAGEVVEHFVAGRA
jgi:antitoxin component YwqK of YwqJK toxin-antitoxin module